MINQVKMIDERGINLVSDTFWIRLVLVDGAYMKKQ